VLLKRIGLFPLALLFVLLKRICLFPLSLLFVLLKRIGLFPLALLFVLLKRIGLFPLAWYGYITLRQTDHVMEEMQTIRVNDPKFFH
jgi:hypothetical protein